MQGNICEREREGKIAIRECFCSLYDMEMRNEYAKKKKTKLNREGLEYLRQSMVKQEKMQSEHGLKAKMNDKYEKCLRRFEGNELSFNCKTNI